MSLSLSFLMAAMARRVVKARRMYVAMFARSLI